MAASATFALKAGVWFRRGRLLMVSPDSRSTACPPSGRNSTYRPVQISGTGSNLARHRNASGQEQQVAMGPVVLPFLIGAEIGHRGLDLDDPDLAASIERHQIGAAAGRQRQFAHHGKAMRRSEE